MSCKQKSPNKSGFSVIQCCYPSVHLMSVTCGGVTTVLQEIVVDQLSQYFCFSFLFPPFCFLGCILTALCVSKARLFLGWMELLAQTDMGKCFSCEEPGLSVAVVRLVYQNESSFFTFFERKKDCNSLVYHLANNWDFWHPNFVFWSISFAFSYLNIIIHL